MRNTLNVNVICGDYSNNGEEQVETIDTTSQQIPNLSSEKSMIALLKAGTIAQIQENGKVFAYINTETGFCMRTKAYYNDEIDDIQNIRKRVDEKIKSLLPEYSK